LELKIIIYYKYLFIFRKIFSFLDEAEKTDRDTLLGLQYEASNSSDIFDQTPREKEFMKKQQGNNMPFLQK
jgi:hypothetical protein